jgi:hypothetical protein
VNAEARHQDGGVEIQARADGEAQDVGDYRDSFHLNYAQQARLSHPAHPKQREGGR